MQIKSDLSRRTRKMYRRREENTMNKEEKIRDRIVNDRDGQ